MTKKGKTKKSLAYKLQMLQFSAGSLFLITLVAFISVVLAMYLNKKEANNPAYIFIFILFSLSCLFVIINSLFGIKFAIAKNNKRLYILFLLAVILIIPFVSIYAIFAASTTLFEYQ